MKKTHIVVDLGSSQISIYLNSLIFRAPSVAVVKRNPLRLVAVGKEAISKAHSLEKDEYFISPINCGIIENISVCSLLINHYLDMALPNYSLMGNFITVLTPCSLTKIERDNIFKSFEKTGNKDIELKESVLGYLPYIGDKVMAGCSIGAELTEVAILNKSGIVNACSINIGGSNINKKIEEILMTKFNLRVGALTLERIKLKVGSLFDNDKTSISIEGRDILTGELKLETIKAEDIYQSIVFYIKKITDLLESLLTTITPDQMLEVTKQGIILAGGSANLKGISSFIQKNIGIPVTTVDYPDSAIPLGIVKLINNKV